MPDVALLLIVGIVIRILSSWDRIPALSDSGLHQLCPVLKSLNTI